MDLIQIHDAGLLSDHRLVTSFLPATKMKPRTVSYSFRDLKNMNFDSFRSMMMESTLFSNPETTTDSFAEQFRTVVGAVLDSVAPLQTKFKQRGPKSNRWLTPEAVKAKRHRRHLDKRWRRSGDETVRIEYRRSCRSTNRIITDCRSRFIKERIDQANNSKQQW